MSKKMVSLIMVFTILLTFTLVGCRKDPNKYTEEEHMRRISERVQAKYIDSSKKYTGFSVYPLYAGEESITAWYFLIEFEPCDFLFVAVNSNNNNIASCGIPISMYAKSSLCLSWQRYKYGEDEEGNQIKIYETSPKGYYNFYDRSYYKTAEVEDERLYLLHARFPAVKRGDNFLNLISMEEMVTETYSVMKEKYPAIYLGFHQDL